MARLKTAEHEVISLHHARKRPREEDVVKEEFLKA
jgi:hypothetical protein